MCAAMQTQMLSSRCPTRLAARGQSLRSLPPRHHKSVRCHASHKRQAQDQQQQQSDLQDQLLGMAGLLAPMLLANPALAETPGEQHMLHAGAWPYNKLSMLFLR